MNEPLLQADTQAAKSSLWDKAPGWRNLIVGASALTLTALALPLILPQPPGAAQAPIGIQDVAVTPMITLRAPPAVNAAAPAGAADHAQQQVASLLPQQTAPVPDLSALPVGTEIVSSGILARVNRHNRGDLPVSITIISPPAHGAVSTRRETAPFTSSGNGVTRISPVTSVFYQSVSGYVGPDSFTYKRTSPDPNDPFNANTYTMHIYVK